MIELINWIKDVFVDTSKQSGQPSFEVWRAERDAKEAAEKARKQSEWDALPDHRKAARIEYKLLQGLVPKIDPHEQLAALMASNYQSQMPSNALGAYYSYCGQRDQGHANMVNVFGI